MPKIADPTLLAQLNSGKVRDQAVLSQLNGFVPVTGPKPQTTAGYAVAGSPAATTPQTYIPGGEKDPAVAARLAGAEAAARQAPQTAAELRLVGARTAADVAAARAKAQIENEAKMAQLQQERQFKLQQTPQQQAMAAMSNDEVLSAIQQARNEINAGHSTGFVGQVFNNFGGTNAKDLSGTLNTIKGNLTLDNLQKLKAASTTGASGMGSLTEKEGELLASTVASLDQSQSSEKLLDGLAKIENHYRRWSALNAGQDPNSPEVAKRYGLVAAAPTGVSPSGPGSSGPGDPPLTLSQNGTQTIVDPTLAGVNQKVAGMIKAGMGAGAIKGYLNTIQPGLGDRSQNIDQWVKFHQQNPAQPIAVALDRKEVPLSQAADWVNKAAQSQIGAGVMSAADAASLGTLDNMTSNPALARAGMAGVQAQHPYASVAGTIAGNMADGLGIDALLGRAGMAAGKGVLSARPLLSDALYGAGYGAGSSDDNRLGGAVGGALASTGGGMFGRGIMTGAGKALTGVTDAGKRYLADAGVPLTIGQMAGGAAKGLEDRLSGLPLVGDAIKARQGEGVQAFNKAAFNEALSPIGQTAAGQVGEAGINNADDAIGQAYKAALAGQQVTADMPFKTANGALAQSIPAIPRVGQELAAGIDKAVTPMFGPGGTLSGEGMQAAIRGLQQLKGGYSNDPLYATHIAPAVDDVAANLRGLFDRQAPDVLPAFDKAQEAYKKFVPVRDAVNASVNTGGVFTPAQLGRADRQSTIAFGGKTAAASGDRRFFDLQRAGQDVLPSKIPDSGTAGRMVLPLLAGSVFGGGDYATEGKDKRSAASSLGVGALAALAAAAPYSKAGQTLAQAALMGERPAAAVAVGDFMKKNARVGGMFGNPLALQYYGIQP